MLCGSPWTGYYRIKRGFYSVVWIAADPTSTFIYTLCNHFCLYVVMGKVHNTTYGFWCQQIIWIGDNLSYTVSIIMLDHSLKLTSVRSTQLFTPEMQIRGWSCVWLPYWTRSEAVRQATAHLKQANSKPTSTEEALSFLSPAALFSTITEKRSQTNMAASAFYGSHKSAAQTPLNGEVNTWTASSVVTQILYFQMRYVTHCNCNTLQAF